MSRRPPSHSDLDVHTFACCISIPSPSKMVSPEEELATFLRMAPINLGSEPSLSPDLDFAYTPIELDVGEFVSCVRWDGAYYMIGTDVARTLAFRLSLHGEQVAELRQLKRTVCSRLRSIKEGHGMLLEPANVR